MSDKTWKAFERVVAAFFATQRNPLSSRWSRHDTESDSLHPRLYIEAKRDKSYLGKRLLDLIDDTWACARKEGKIPVIAMKRHGKHGFYLLVHSSNLKEIAHESATDPDRGTDREGDREGTDQVLVDPLRDDHPRPDSDLGAMA